jgi:hypothetical protein
MGGGRRPLTLAALRKRVGVPFDVYIDDHYAPVKIIVTDLVHEQLRGERIMRSNWLKDKSKQQRGQLIFITALFFEPYNMIISKGVYKKKPNTKWFMGAIQVCDGNVVRYGSCSNNARLYFTKSPNARREPRDGERFES